MNSPAKLWAVIPAAGTGTRMGAQIPKQYLPLNGKTVLQVTLDKIASIPQIHEVVVALADEDKHFQQLEIPPNILRVTGGNQRANSVLNGLQYIINQNGKNDWVLVHDAARPCVNIEKIQLLIETVLATFQNQGAQTFCGGILAIPVTDTLKKANDTKISHTVNRANLWAAHTPQLFRVSDLFTAIHQAQARNHLITDEASAIEFLGGEVLLIQDHRDNIKITLPEDLAFAEHILQMQILPEEQNS
jgi:2-C-methyl-D-erythritol 4-phosphate cytidylyltransferase